MWVEGRKKILTLVVATGKYPVLTNKFGGAGTTTTTFRKCGQIFGSRGNQNILTFPAHLQSRNGAPLISSQLYHQLVRGVSTLRLTKNMELLTDTNKPLVLRKDKDSANRKFAVELVGRGDAPLVVMIPWLMSERKHVLKYAQFYLDQGCHIVTVTCSPRQLLFPTLNGGIMVANDLLNFLLNNPQYSTKMLHGFSIAAFVWSQTLVLIEKDPVRYRQVIDSFVGQVWDSLVDIEGLSGGVGSAVFPNSRLMRDFIGWYGRFHVDTFQNLATKHYLASRKAYYNTIVKCPSLFFCSEDDKVAFHYIVMRIADMWEKQGVKIYMKSWKTSQHILHLQKHPEEYRAEMNAFLNAIGLLRYPDRFPIHVPIKESVKARN